MFRFIGLLGLLAWLLPAAAPADSTSDLEPFEALEFIELEPIGAHSVWVTDVIFRQSLLFDADTGEALATIGNAMGSFPKPPIFSSSRNEFYVPEAQREWGHRGERTDFVTVYDAKTLQAETQIVIPTQSGESAGNVGYANLLDGEDTLAIYNQFPAQSVSLIDVGERAFIGSVSTGGCAGIYPTGELSFATLCGDGTLREVEVDAEGQLIRDESTSAFFNVVEDPVMMNGSRVGDRWVFISFSGVIHDVDFGTSPPTVRSWSGVDTLEKSEGWRPGGRQGSGAHQQLERLYILFHAGESGSHKDPGPEVWVFDLKAGSRIDRFSLPNMDASAIAGLLGLEGGFAGWLLENIVPATGGDTLAITQDDEPLLLVRNSSLPIAAVLDAQTGEHLRNLTEIGISGYQLTVPR
ncbi:MAG: amine dehydrogenase large subunit [Myxococcota bacterium]|nr:amine dehydrogenase large subunit [Myxococcota bacterium]